MMMGGDRCKEAPPPLGSGARCTAVYKEAAPRTVASICHALPGNDDEASTPPHYNGGMPRALEALRAEAHRNAEQALQRRRLLFRLKRIDDALHVWVLRELAHQPGHPSTFRTPTVSREELERLRERAQYELMDYGPY
jgi:hypothetical protein